MNKREYDTNKFGGFLHELRKLRGIGFEQFRTHLGVSKAYLNDVETDAARPPTPEVQVKILAYLNDFLPLGEEEEARFYSLAAEERGELPADIAIFLSSDKGTIQKIRATRSFKLYWQKYGK